MSASRQPNVLVFLTDQQRWDCAGLHGNPLDLMPNFDRLARAGTHIRHSFSCQPLCTPARAALQTGLYGTRSGLHRNECSLPVTTRTLAHHFAAAGYRTGYIGKWHLAPTEFLGAVPREHRGGYQDWMAANVLELVSDAYDCRLYDEQNVEHRLPGYRVDAVTDVAVEYLARPRTQPFFLFLSYLEPHHQNSRDDYPAPEGYAERYQGRWMPRDLAALGGTSDRQLAGYLGMVKRLDEALGRIIATLRANGQLDNTILLFTSDHGCHFKTRNGEYKRSCHDSSIRVPTMWHGPGFMGGGDRPELVSLIDLPPTLLDAVGLPIPPDMQGHSLMPLLRGTDSTWSNEIFIQISESQNARALRTPHWKYSVTVRGTDGAIARHAASWPSYEEESLYDLTQDPYELNNLITRESHREIAAQLRHRLLKRMVAAGEQAPVITPAFPAGDGRQAALVQ
jgi:arylsulfatase A-like enzyme